MSKGRMEAFSDGVIAILITIMVLDLKAPLGSGWTALRPLGPALASYVLSYIYLGIYWNNHHHLLHAVGRVSGAILWANLHLLFWLSLVPITTAWMGVNGFASLPTALYGAVLLLAAVAYRILVAAILRLEGPSSRLALAVGRDFKGKISIVLYAAAIPVAFVRSWVANATYATVAAIWLVPDRRIESRLRD